jgi:hypothetical protein
MAWMKDLGAKGQLKDQGNPLEDGGKVVKGKAKTVTDGPYAETKDVIGGSSRPKTSPKRPRFPRAARSSISTASWKSVRSCKCSVEPSDHLFRRESGRMVAALTRVFGVHNLALAEDVV